MHRIRALFIIAGLMAAPLTASAQTTNTYTYDDLGRLKSVTYPSGPKTGYNYDAADNRTKAQTALNGVLNSAPNCGVAYIPITVTPSSAPPVPITGSLTTIPCSDPDGDTMTVISPTTAPNFTLAAGQSYSYGITVSDGNGGVTPATVTYHRN